MISFQKWSSGSRDVFVALDSVRVCGGHRGGSLGFLVQGLGAVSSHDQCCFYLYVGARVAATAKMCCLAVSLAAESVRFAKGLP